MLMLKKLAAPFLTLTMMAAFGCSSSSTPTPGTGGAGGTATGGAGGAGGAAGAGSGGNGGAGATVTYQVTLDGPQDSLPNVTGTGMATVTLNTTTGAVSVSNGTYTGLTGAATMAHIHGPAAPGVSAGVIVPLTVTAGTPVTSGTFGGTGTLTTVQIGYMTSGMTYLNIHTADNTSGEIRGNILPAQ
jgi:hypothetical protein